MRFRAVLLAVLLVPSLICAQELGRLSVNDWLGGKATTKPIPRATWVKGGVILRDRGGVPEKYDPATGTRTSLYDVKWINELLFRPDLTRSQRRPSPVVGQLIELDSSGTQGLFTTQTRGASSGFIVVKFDKKEVIRLDAGPAAKSFQFSPDGSKIAYVENNDLYLADLSRRGPALISTNTRVRADSLSTSPLQEDMSLVAPSRRLTASGTETLLNGTLNWVYWEEVFGRRDIGYWWSPDSKAIAFLETDQSKIEPTYFPDPRVKLETPIKQYYPRAGTPNPTVRVGVLELGQVRGTDFQLHVDPKPVQWIDIPPASYEYILRVKWLPNNRELAIITMNRMQTDVELIFAPRTGGAGRVALKEHDSAYVNVTDDLTFLKGGSEFIWASEKTGYYHLYRFNSAGKELNAITKGGWGLVSNPGPAFWVRQSISYVDEEHGWVYFTTNKDQSIQRHLYRAKLDGSAMEKITKEPGVHAINFDPLVGRYLDTYSNLLTPPSLVLADPAGSRIPLQDPDLDLAQRVHIDMPEFTNIPARDRFPMPALVKRPRDYREGGSKKYPVIIYCYGGPSAPSVLHEWQEPGWEQVLCDAGYAVVTFDNRTATSISKRIESLSVKEYMGKVELNDLVDAARWLKQQAWVDPERIGVWGWSNGGTYTLLGMARSTEFKAGIAVAPVVDMSLYDSKWAESAMKTPESNRDGYEEVRLDKYAKDLSGRLLLVHGTYDDNVHPQHSWRFIDELVKANKQFDMLMYPMRMHGIGDEPARRHLYTAMLEFWRRWL